MNNCLTSCSLAAQAPLQPLQDNLENSTYETFERDSIKYTKYEEAIRQALCDMASAIEVVVIMVVGAGRGPLVRASLQVGRAEACKIGQDLSTGFTSWVVLMH